MQRIAPKPAVQLGLFALACALCLAGAHALTHQNIAANEARHRAKLLAEVMPAAAALVQTKVEIAAEQQALWQARSADGVTGVVLAITASGGYSGDIELLLGLDKQLTLTGVRVTKHRETPGLGDYIDTRRGDWIKVFSGLSLANPTANKWALKKDGGYFDQFTGATITPRAVVKSVKQTLQYAQKHKKYLFGNAAAEQKP